MTAIQPLWSSLASTFTKKVLTLNVLSIGFKMQLERVMSQVCMSLIVKTFWVSQNLLKSTFIAQATIGVMYKTGEGVKEQSIEKVRSTLGYVTIDQTSSIADTLSQHVTFRHSVVWNMRRAAGIITHVATWPNYNTSWSFLPKQHQPRKRCMIGINPAQRNLMMQKRAKGSLFPALYWAAALWLVQLSFTNYSAQNNQVVLGYATEVA